MLFREKPVTKVVPPAVTKALREKKATKECLEPRGTKALRVLRAKKAKKAKAVLAVAPLVLKGLRANAVM